eukprot:SAG22_NODE_119_length_19257_cov_43.260413_12_plen_71_part_00
MALGVCGVAVVLVDGDIGGATGDAGGDGCVSTVGSGLVPSHSESCLVPSHSESWQSRSNCQVQLYSTTVL